MSDLARKIRLKPGEKAAIIHAPENYLQDLQHDAEISSTLRGKFDWIQIFVWNKTELDELAPKAASALKPESMLWLPFPKDPPKFRPI
jgi:hypothetical protein